MRALLLGVTLLIVAAASALNLVLGAVWLAALGLLLLVRRRLRYAAGLTLVLALVAGVALARAGWLTPPPAASYADDETAWLRARVPLGDRRDPEAAAPAGTALRARLDGRRLEELRLAADDLDRRAAAAVRVSRELGGLRGRVSAEVRAVQEAVARLALTLTAPEFRDLDGRRARLRAWFAELEARLAAARDETELDAIARALEPAAMAPISFRAVREDLARVDAAMAALVRALAGGGVAVTATSRLEYDEIRRQLRREDRYVFTADPPLRITGLDVGALRRAAIGRGLAQTLAYGTAEGEPREPFAGAEIALAPGVARVVVADRRVAPVTPLPVRAPLRLIPFRRLALDGAPGASAEFLITMALGDAVGPEPLLGLRAGPPRLDGIALPRDALHYASLPGRVAPTGDRDVWVPLDPTRATQGVVLEVLPATVLLRNPLFAPLGPYLYTPNLAATLALTGLAALALVLVRRPRAAAPAPPAP